MSGVETHDAAAWTSFSLACQGKTSKVGMATFEVPEDADVL